jgi:anaerobic magnesium-protoporphyrin IX monomethyl ester cyclase
MNKVLLFNPKSADAKHRVPNALLNIAASVEGKYDWIIVDGNCEKDPLATISAYLQTGEYRYLGITVMPGPVPQYDHHLGWIFPHQPL